MERESFENPDIAKLMNENFINIKVDREERPDVDKVYMTFVTVSFNFFYWKVKGMEECTYVYKIFYNFLCKLQNDNSFISGIEIETDNSLMLWPFWKPE